MSCVGQVLRNKAIAGEVGRKDDATKARFSLLPTLALRSVVDVLGFGAMKYSPGNWRNVDDARERYFNASQRHLWAWFGGEVYDAESGLHHLAHAACSVLFLLELEREGRFGKGTTK